MTGTNIPIGDVRFFGREEGIYLAEIDLDMLRDYRDHEVIGEAYRHPDKYGILIERERKC